MARVELLFLMLFLLLGRNTHEVLVSSARQGQLPLMTKSVSFRISTAFFLSSGMERQRHGQPTMRQRQRLLRIKRGTEIRKNPRLVRGQ